jgi:hypothetical protein
VVEKPEEVGDVFPEGVHLGAESGDFVGHPVNVAGFWQEYSRIVKVFDFRFGIFSRSNDGCCGQAAVGAALLPW